ncbi:hypothetical protein [Azospirillum sp. sgz302134]
MQAPFSLLTPTLEAVGIALSQTRISRYLTEARGNRQLAMRLYQWNADIGESLYWPLQTLEITCRNAIARVLEDKYGAAWHMDGKFHRTLDDQAFGKLKEALNRQERKRGAGRVVADHVIADLSFGFWTSLMTRSYEVPFGWTSRLCIAFPFIPFGATRQTVSRPLDDARALRNRISHHEPLLGLRLTIKYREILDVLGWTCPETRWYVEQHSRFLEVWDSHPAPALRRGA